MGVDQTLHDETQEQGVTMTTNYSEKCQKILQAASAKMDGVPVLYATQYGRPDNRLGGTSTARVAQFAFDNALKAVSQAIGSGLPTDGWIVMTDTGMGVFSRRVGGSIGAHKGTIPNKLIGSVSIQHDKKPGKARIDLIFADNSEVTLFTKTKETYEALSPWVQGRSAGASSPLVGPGSSAPNAPTDDLFDMDALYSQNSSLRSH